MVKKRWLLLALLILGVGLLLVRVLNPTFFGASSDSPADPDGNATPETTPSPSKTAPTAAPEITPPPSERIRLMTELNAKFAKVDSKDPDPDPRVTMPCSFRWSPRGCMVRVPGGKVFMGAQSTDAKEPNYDPNARKDEDPVHEVDITPFWMHQDEVTNYHFKKCIAAGACSKTSVAVSGGVFNFGRQGRLPHPVNGVSWDGAQSYCRWIGGRLPTEAEWEHAARTNPDDIYPDNGRTPTCPRVIMKNGCGAESTAPMHVTSDLHQAPFSLAGNLLEWVGDYYEASYYERSPTRDPRGPAHGTSRVLRGGSWMSESIAELRSAYRTRDDPTAQMPDIGFRCVRSSAHGAH